MKKILTWLFWGPVAVLVIMIAVANRQFVTFSLDPLSTTDPLISFDLPLFILLLGSILVGLLIGGTASWINQRKWRRAAREGLHEAAALRRQVDATKRSSEFDRSGPTGQARLPSPDLR